MPNRKVISLDSDVLGIGFLNNFSHRTSTTPVDFNPISALVKDLGTNPTAINSFFPWKLQQGEYQSFPKDFCEYVNQLGSIPLITWAPGQANKANQVEDRDRTNPQPDFNCVSISSGMHDDYIRSWVRDAKAYGKPVYVRYMHEFIGAPYPTSYMLDKVWFSILAKSNYFSIKHSIIR